LQNWTTRYKNIQILLQQDIVLDVKAKENKITLFVWIRITILVIALLSKRYASVNAHKNKVNNVIYLWKYHLSTVALPVSFLCTHCYACDVPL
jgi:hypothetical protein